MDSMTECVIGTQFKGRSEEKQRIYRALAQAVSARAIVAFEECRMDELDPLVGDTQCQLRAHFIADAYRHYERGDFRAVVEGVKAWTKGGAQARVPELGKHAQRMQGIVLSYMLTYTALYKEAKGRRETEHRKLKELAQLSNKETLGIVARWAQPVLARMTVEAMRRVADGLKGCELVKEALQCGRADAQKRPLIPTYFSVRAVLEAERQAGRPIAVIIRNREGEKRSRLFFSEEGSYRPTDKKFANQAVVKFEFNTQVSWEKVEEGIEEHGIEELLLTCVAQHAQYGSRKVKEQTIPHEEAQAIVERQARRALEIGTHWENRSLLFATHIRTGYLKEGEVA